MNETPTRPRSDPAHPAGDRRVTIGEAARRSGLTVKAVRFYEAQGLVPPAPRRGAYRTYGAQDLQRLAFLRQARELGFSLAELRAVMDNAFEPGHCERVYAALSGRRALLRQQAQALLDQASALDQLEQRLRGGVGGVGA